MEIEKKLRVWLISDKTVRYKEYTVIFHDYVFGIKISVEYKKWSHRHLCRPEWAETKQNYNPCGNTGRCVNIYINGERIYDHFHPEIYKIYWKHVDRGRYHSGFYKPLLSKPGKYKNVFGK